MAHADGARRLRGARQRRHRRGRRPGPPLRRRRASACAAPSTCSSASAAQLVERLILADTDDEQATRRSTALLPLQREDFVEHLRGDGRPAGHDPAARPAAARVPARHHRAVGAGRAGRGARRGARGRPAAAAGRAPAARAEPDARACAACASASSIPGLFAMQVRAIAEAAAERHQGRRRPARRDHDPAGRRPSRSSRSSARRPIQVVARGRAAETGVAPGVPRSAR